MKIRVLCENTQALVDRQAHALYYDNYDVILNAFCRRVDILCTPACMDCKNSNNVSIPPPRQSKITSFQI